MVVNMTQVAQLVARVDRLIEKSGFAPSTVSRKVFKDGKRLDALREGSRMFPETIEAVEKRLKEVEVELLGARRA